MLLHLHVKNLALIEEAEMEFGPGLNILTGETGAGKSILLGSIQLILGVKASRGMIRENTSHALVELLFQLENEHAKKALEEMDIFPEDGQVLLSRRITEGRSICKINGETCTASRMKAAASCLLDIHGQHEHQSLLYPDKQLEILDAYGKDEIWPAREQVEKAYQEYRRIQAALKGLDIDEEQKNREMSFLAYEIQEIESAALREGEDEELEKSYRKLSNGRRIIETLQNVKTLTGYEGSGAGDQVGEAIREISRVTEFDEDLPSLEGMLTEVDGLLNDFNRELSSYMDDLVFDDETFAQVEQRLDLINTLKAKYGQSIGQILAYGEGQKEKLEKLRRHDELLEKTTQELKAAEEVLKQASEELSQLRRKAALSLEEKVIRELWDLNFADVAFSIAFSQKKSYTANGFDDIEYLISTNPGEQQKPLGKIVSGGELSRIMLALKTILADKDEIETLIFDEIDTGISGRTAQKVSEKMAVIGRQHQVLCITHLPQIAAMADTHFEIEKHVENQEMHTCIHALTGEASIRELARLLGGARITEAVLQNAREMKELAQAQKRTRA